MTVNFSSGINAQSYLNSILKIHTRQLHIETVAAGLLRYVSDKKESVVEAIRSLTGKALLCNSNSISCTKIVHRHLGYVILISF